MHLNTLAVHAGGAADPETGALAPPLHLSTTFEHAPDGSLPHGLIYQRHDNPTQQRLEQALAALDGGKCALLFATGMAAGATLLQTLPSGSHVLMQDDLYHGVRALAASCFNQWGLQFSSVDMTRVDDVRAAIRDDTALLWTESPSNPLLKVIDIAAVAELAHAQGARLLVDATFATPCLQRPLALGADVVMHSATKYMGGHSDVMGGVLVFGNDDEHAQRAMQLRQLLGSTASPFSAWMILRGLRSLPARLDWQCRSANTIAHALAEDPRVDVVHYPGLASHAQHALATRQMSAYGGMLSIEVAGGREPALAAAGALRLFTNATSLGGCESLVEHRASIEGTQPVSPQGLLRLSIGLEQVDDLLADLDQALG